MPDFLSIGVPIQPDHRIMLAELSIHDVEVICNGCGPKGGLCLTIAFPKDIGQWKYRLLIPIPQWHSESTCNQHDLDYWVGGLEADKRAADLALLEGLRSDAKHASEYWRGGFRASVMYSLKMMQAYLYYLAVRYSRIAHCHFHYSISPQCRYRTLDQLKAYTAIH